MYNIIVHSGSSSVIACIYIPSPIANTGDNSECDTTMYGSPCFPFSTNLMSRLHYRIVTRINERATERFNAIIDARIHERINEMINERVNERIDERTDDRIDERNDEGINGNINERISERFSRIRTVRFLDEPGSSTVQAFVRRVED